MGKRKALVVYYSRTGTTAKVGKAIAEALGADLEEITDKTSRKGITGWLKGGKDSLTKKTTPIGEIQNDPAAYDLYTSNSIMDLSMGYLMLQTTSNDHMRLWLQLRQCSNLVEGVWSNAGDAVEWLRLAPDGKVFYRVRGGE